MKRFRFYLGFLVFNFTIAYGSITGIVFNDFNSNGTYEKGEVGVKGVTIQAYDSGGNKVAETLSDDNGTYSLDNLQDAKYRIEFTNLPSPFKESAAEGSASSSVQFVNSSNIDNINFAVINPNKYYPAKDKIALAVPTFHPGASVNKTDLAKKYGIISLPYTATGNANGKGDLNNPDFSKDTTFSKMGTVWGTGYQRGSGFLYAAAFLKRHQGLGELVRPALGSGEKDVPVDGIYIMDYNGTVGGVYKGGFKLNGITPANGDGGVINLGTVKREIISAKVNSSHPNALTTNTSNNRSYDIDAFNKVGRVGFGDLDIDESDKNLWVINLNQKSLIKIDISNPDNLATNDFIDSSLVSHYKIDLSSLPTCNGEYHPWALGFNNNKGYVGVICDATGSKSADDLKAYILEFDPNNPTTFDLAKDFPLNYNRETSQYSPSYGTCDLGSQSNWNYWAKTWKELGAALGKDAKGANDSTYGAERSCPEPILSDITFDGNGDMIVGFMDRFSLQLDRVNYAATTTIATNRYYSADSAGDTIHLCKTDTGYLVEGESGCVIDNDTKIDGDKPDDRLKTDDGPNGVGEFYFQDYSTEYDSGKSAHHVENNLGSVVALPVASEVITTAYDAIIGTFNQGLLWYNTNSSDKNRGKRSNQYQVSKEGDDQLNTKGMGLGDVELIIPPTPIEIGNRVWLDSNRNGIQDANEEPLLNVKVELYKGSCGSGDKVGEIYTDANGEYYFGGAQNSGLVNGYSLEPKTNYQICISLNDPVISDKNVTVAKNDEDNRDSDGDNGVLNSNYSTIDYTTGDYGENNHNLDFGFTPTYCLGDYVWEDKNANGIQDSNESGIANITAELYKNNSSTGKTVVTNSDGKYEFCKLEPGNYSVKFSNIPKGYIVTKKDATADNNDSDVDPNTLTSDSVEIKDKDNKDIDLGLIKLVCIGDYVWYDKNKNGLQDSNEDAIENVKVELWQNGSKIADTDTNSSGYYEFCKLQPNSSFKVKFITPQGYAPTKSNEGDDTKDSDPINGEVAVSVGSDNNMTIDAGFKKVCLGDYVWEDSNTNGIQDSNESGIKDVSITLKDKNSGAVIATTSTDNNGKYEFCDLDVNKDYTVEFTTPKNYAPTKANATDDNNDSDIIDGKVDVSLGKDDDMSIDAGFYKSVCLGDYVWEDKNANGIQDSNESGIDNVEVTLYLNNSEINKTTTKNGGAYKFCDLLPNKDYTVKFTKPAGYVTTTPNGTTDTTKDSNIDPQTNETTVSLGEDSDYTIDAGFIKPVCVGDFIWEDKNANGIQDNGEVGVSGAVVKIRKSDGSKVVDANGNELADITTSSDGKYKFCNLNPGDYYIEVTPPKEYYVSPKDSENNDTKDSDIDTTSKKVEFSVESGVDNLTLDAGLFKPACLGDYIFEDKNANGIQDMDESGIEGVKVELYDAKGQSVKDVNGSKVEAQTTKSDGKYKFCSLVPGDYHIKVTPPSDYVISPKDSGSDDSKDSDIDESSKESENTTLESGEDDPTWDAGVYKKACLGDYVWKDNNANGIQENGEEPIEGVKVTLLDKNGTELKTTKTNSDGKYEFCELTPGEYGVKFEAAPDENGVPYVTTKKDAGDDTKDSDVEEYKTGGGKTNNVVLESGDNNKTLDAGFIQEICLGDYAWEDENANGLQDINESAIEGVKVTLLDENGDVAKDVQGKSVADVVTNSEGKYKFCHLVPSKNYKIVFEKPQEYVITDKDMGDDSKDSDIDENSTIVTNSPAETNMTFDAGYFKPACVGNRVWLDKNANGIQDEDENGIEGVTLKLLDANGNEVTKDAYGNSYTNEITTNAKGEYKFCDLKPGEYKLQIIPPEGYYVTTKDVTSKSSDIDDVDNDSDFDENTKETVVVTLSSGEDDKRWDAGVFKPASLGDFIFEDVNANGIQDNSEKGAVGVQVELLDNNEESVIDVNGKKIEPTIIEQDGKYEFNNLRPGTYHIKTLMPKDKNYRVTFANRGDDDSKDSDLEPVYSKDIATTPDVTLKSGENNLNSDGGVFEPACLGSAVWLDKNGDGVQQEDEPGIGNVTVTLLDENGGDDLLDASGNKIEPIITKADGKYKFCNLVPGAYRVKFETKPENGAPYISTGSGQGEESVDSDIPSYMVSRGVTEPISVKSGDDIESVKAGFIKEVCVGDYVWHDENLNGLQDKNEPGVVDVTVALYDANRKPVKDVYGNVVKPVKTNKDGKYKFCHLVPAKDYNIKVEVPESYTVTLPDVAKNRKNNIDSDIKKDGWIAVKSVVKDDYSYDAGIICDCDDYKIRPEEYKDMSASAFNIFGALASIFIFFLLAKRRD